MSENSASLHADRQQTEGIGFPSDKKHFFITGFPRSGTTLTQQLLNAAEDVSCYNQPLPYAYYKAKNDFLDKRKVSQAYPLDDLFLQAAYRPKDFTDFLRDYRFTYHQLLSLKAAQESYSGALDDIRIPPDTCGRMSEVYNQLFSHLHTKACGTKEVFCEEYIDYYLRQGIKCIMLIRDPADLIGSVIKGRQLGGKRPLIYYIRQWRKSVAFALQYQGHPDLLCLRYEDLATHPETTWQKLATFIGINETYEEVEKKLFARWKGNSNFNTYHTITEDAIGTSAASLSATAGEYIKLLCQPELNVLYNQQAHLAPDQIASLSDDITPTHSMAAKLPQHDKNTLIQEQIRQEMLMNGRPTIEDQQKWFIFESVYDKLRARV